MKRRVQPAKDSSSLPSPPITPPKWSASPATGNDNHEPSTPSPKKRKRSTQPSSLSSDEAHERLLERNRQAASKCREKRKREAERLKDCDAILECKHDQLRAHVDQLRNEVTRVKEELLKHHACGDPTLNAYLRCQASLLPIRFVQGNPAAFLSSPEPGSAAPSQDCFQSSPQGNLQSSPQGSLQSPTQATFHSPQLMMPALPSLPSPPLDTSGNSFNPNPVSPVSASSTSTLSDVPVTGPFNGVTLGSIDPALPTMGEEMLPSDQLPSAMLSTENFLSYETNIFDDMFLVDPELYPDV